jgi:hypothetical protein
MLLEQAQERMQKKVSIAFGLLLLLSSCNIPKPNHWHSSAIRSVNPDYDLAKLIYPASNQTNGIEIELIRQGDLVRGYLNVYSSEIPALLHDPHKAKVVLITEKEEKTFAITRLEGGQRLALSHEGFETLISALKETPSLTIKTGHFTQTINSKSFEKKFGALLKKPFRFSPEKLVTFEFY